MKRCDLHLQILRNISDRRLVEQRRQWKKRHSNICVVEHIILSIAHTFLMNIMSYMHKEGYNRQEVCSTVRNNVVNSGAQHMWRF